MPQATVKMSQLLTADVGGLERAAAAATAERKRVAALLEEAEDAEERAKAAVQAEQALRAQLREIRRDGHRIVCRANKLSLAGGWSVDPSDRDVCALVEDGAQERVLRDVRAVYLGGHCLYRIPVDQPPRRLLRGEDGAWHPPHLLATAHRYARPGYVEVEDDVTEPLDLTPEQP